MAIDVTFLEEGGQTPSDIAALLAEFVAAARSTLHVAVYDFRLGDAVAGPVVRALRERAAAGVEVLIAYDAGKPHADFPAAGADPAPPGTARTVSPYKTARSIFRAIRDDGAAVAEIRDEFTKLAKEIATGDVLSGVGLTSASVLTI